MKNKSDINSEGNNAKPLLTDVVFVIGIYKNEIWLVEKIETPYIDKYAGYAYDCLLQVDIKHYFEELDTGKAIDSIIQKDALYWNMERYGEGNCPNEIETYRILELIKKEDKLLKAAKKIRYFDLEEIVKVASIINIS
jgi:hypothetical protein